MNGTVHTIWWCPLLCETNTSFIEFWMLRWTKHIMHLLKISCYQHSADILHDVTTTKHPFQNMIMVLQVCLSHKFHKKAIRVTKPRLFWDDTSALCFQLKMHFSSQSPVTSGVWFDLRKYVYRTLIDCSSSTMKHIKSHNWCHCTQYCYYILSVCIIEVLLLQVGP